MRLWFWEGWFFSVGFVRAPRAIFYQSPDWESPKTWSWGKIAIYYELQKQGWSLGPTPKPAGWLILGVLCSCGALMILCRWDMICMMFFGYLLDYGSIDSNQLRLPPFVQGDSFFSVSISYQAILLFDHVQAKMFPWSKFVNFPVDVTCSVELKCWSSGD